jgi:hypothetical protein
MCSSTATSGCQSSGMPITNKRLHIGTSHPQSTQPAACSDAMNQTQAALLHADSTDTHQPYDTALQDERCCLPERQTQTRPQITASSQCQPATNAERLQSHTAHLKQCYHTQLVTAYQARASPDKVCYAASRNRQCRLVVQLQ